MPGITVTITIEQDTMTAGPTPRAVTWRHRMGGVGDNARFIGDAMQTAIVRAATDAAKGLASTVDLRERDVLARALEDLQAVMVQKPEPA